MSRNFKTATGKLHEIGLNFLDRIPKAQVAKAKIGKWG
jgi:hypothetical protein